MYIYQQNKQLEAIIKKMHIGHFDNNSLIWFRNENTLKKIRSTLQYRNEVIEALEYEKKILLDYIKSNFRLDNIKKIQLGGWWISLFYNEFTDFNNISIERLPFSKPYQEDMESGETFECDDCIVQVINK